MTEVKPISSMTDEEIIEELKRLRARRESKAQASRTRSAGNGNGPKAPRQRRGRQLETLDESIEALGSEEEELETLDEA